MQENKETIVDTKTKQEHVQRGEETSEIDKDDNATI